MKTIIIKIVKVKILLFIILILSGSVYAQPVWNTQNSGTANDLNRITVNYFNGVQTLFIAGDNGTLLRSSNYGLIWESINSNTTADLNSIEVSNNDTGYVAGSNGTILRTIDGGISWSGMQSNTNKNIKEIKLLYGNIKAIGVGEDGIFLKLENNVWTVSQIDTTVLNSISYDTFDLNKLLAVGNYGIVLKSTNSGVNWSGLIANTSTNLNYIYNYEIIVGNYGTAFSYNGAVINVINTGTTNNLYGVFKRDIFYLSCGANGSVLKNWQPLNTNSNQQLNSIIQTNSDNCFVTGDNGLILFSNTLNVTPSANQLNSNNISAWYKNNGVFNNHPTTQNAGFEWPKGSGKTARYSSGSVIGAIVNGDTLVTVNQYGSECLPGYTENGIPQGNEDPDYRIYKIIYNESDPDRTNWPNILLGNSDQGAPVFYDPATMQWKPVDYGNQTMFYSYTDSYPEAHTQYSGMTAPLKADIKQINWSFNQPDELKNVIYQEFRIINRSSNVWTNAYINLYSDDDVGIATDDAAGIDTNLSLAYTYNKNAVDGIYGNTPPAVGFKLIRSPLTYTGNNNDTVFYCKGKNKIIKTGYKETGLNSTVVFRDDSDQPENYRENYNAIRGLQNNGSQYINPTSLEPTRFVYSGDPVLGTGWLYPVQSDARFYQGFGPLNMNPGDTQIIVIAQVIASGTSNFNSIIKLREASVTAKEYYDNCFADVVIGINDESSTIPEGFVLYQNYPNPFNPTTNLEFGISELGYVTLRVYDALGKEVATLVNEVLSPGNYNYQFSSVNYQLSSGVYFYRLEAGKFVSTKRMILLK